MPPEEQEKRAFVSLLTPVLDAAFGTAYRMTRNRDEAEDLIQDASVQAFRAFRTFTPGTNFKAWFFKILINQFRNNFRKRSREPDSTPLDDAPDLYLFMQSARAGLLKEEGDPAAFILDRMSEAHIHGVIERLPEEYRLVAVLYFMQELPYQEIAEILGCPLGTVRSRLHRGRKLLQKALWQSALEHGIVSEQSAAEPAAARG